MTIFYDFNDLPVTAPSAVPGDSATLQYMSDQTNVDTNYEMGLYGWAGYKKKNGYVSDSNKRDYLFRRLTGSNGGNETDYFAYLECSDQHAITGRSLKCTVTGGRTNRTGSTVTHGLSVLNKEEYLDHLAVPQDPIANAIVGAPYIFFVNNTTTASPTPLEAAVGNNRLEVYVFTPKTSNGIGGWGNQVQQTMHIAPTSDLLKSFVYPVGHPEYSTQTRKRGHFYHWFYTEGGGWTKYILDSHAQHSNTFNSPPQFPYPGNSSRDMGGAYFDRMNRFYVAHLPYSGFLMTPYDVYYDSLVFATDSEPQNSETINSPSVTYRPGTQEWEVGFNDKYINVASSYSTYQVRYSFSAITNANFSSATPVHIQADARFGVVANTNGIVKKHWPYYAGIWAPFKLDPVDESSVTAGTTVYFAIKDVSQVGGDGQAPVVVGEGRPYNTESGNYDYAGDQPVLNLIKRFDYTVASVGLGQAPIIPPAAIPYPVIRHINAQW